MLETELNIMILNCSILLKKNNFSDANIYINVPKKNVRKHNMRKKYCRLEISVRSYENRFVNNQNLFNVDFFNCNLRYLVKCIRKIIVC